MNKLDSYDANKIVQARKLIDEVRDYNNIQSSSLYRKLNTVIVKLDAILNTELEPELQEEYNRSGRIY